MCLHVRGGIGQTRKREPREPSWADSEGNTRRDPTKAWITSAKDYDVLVLAFTLLLMRRPLSHSTMAGPITYLRDAMLIKVIDTVSCTVWFVGKGKSHLLAAFLGNTNL